MIQKFRLVSGTLWPALLGTTESALRCGALHRIETNQTFVEQDGMRFMVRIAQNLQRKAENKHRVRQEKPQDFNPFLPPEPELTVSNLTETHLAILNKFNVVEHHLLIITRHFEHQETLLTLADFEALWVAMAEYEALVFYNGGEVAGASQRHKHLQMIPLPLADSGPLLPIDPLIDAAGELEGITRLPTLPFPHLFVRLEEGLYRDTRSAAEQSFHDYQAMLDTLDMPPLLREGQSWQSSPYNLLVTRRWMMLVPRSREHYESISINAMGFAGSLFVRNEDELRLIQETGPMDILEAVV